MATDWFYYSGDHRLGPVGSQQLKDLARAGQLQPDTLIWKEGMAEPQAAAKLKGLFTAPMPHHHQQRCQVKGGRQYRRGHWKMVKRRQRYRWSCVGAGNVRASLGGSPRGRAMRSR